MSRAPYLDSITYKHFGTILSRPYCLMIVPSRLRTSPPAAVQLAAFAAFPLPAERILGRGFSSRVVRRANRYGMVGPIFNGLLAAMLFNQHDEHETHKTYEK